MNERIKLLEKQASDYYWSLDDDVRTADAFTQKLAELIVKECAEIADTADATREKWEGIGKYVRQHFGVEE